MLKCGEEESIQVTGAEQDNTDEKADQESASGVRRVVVDTVMDGLEEFGRLPTGSVCL